LPSDLRKVSFPFLGGGSLELALASRGFDVTGYTNFRLLYDFWDCVKRDPEKVYQMAMGFYPLQDPKLFYMLQKKVYEPHDEFLRSALFYVLTLCADGQSATSGTIEAGTPRFNHLRLMQLSKFESPNFKVQLKQYSEVLENSIEYLVCVPPPYIVGNFVNAVTIPERPQIDHEEYADQMSEIDNWIILYNYHKNLRDLYPDNEIVLLDSASRPTNDEHAAKEVVIIGS
tara:strand:+ start:5808 stop:6494 length:687 start_codon:yes stop_codon:yes gene_type:complete